MKILNITAKKQKLGYEDIVIGTGHITQTRSDITKKFYHKINLQCNLGLISTCDFNSIPSDLTEIYFTGYYEEGDAGEGIYRCIGNDTTHNVGIYISNGIKCWKREFNEYVKPEWFGAKGDGLTDDAIPFTTALLYGSIELTEGKHYKIELLQTNIIPLSKSIDLIGNNAILEINSILETNKLIFSLEPDVTVKFKFVTFKSNLPKIFNFYNSITADIKYCEFIPESINPFNTTEYLTQQGQQTLTTTTILEGRNFKNIVATNELHPINKNDLKSLKIEEIPNAVSVNGDDEITGLKTFYVNPIGPKAVEPNQIVTLGQMKELVKLPQSIKDIIDAWLLELKEGQGEYGKNECPYPVSSAYIQPHGTKDPNELWPGTEWVKLEFNDGGIITNITRNEYGEVNLIGKESINA